MREISENKRGQGTRPLRGTGQSPEIFVHLPKPPALVIHL
jgi:hypothetical protein